MAALLWQQAGGRPMPEGQLTQTVYGLISDQRFADAIQLLERELQCLPDSRPGLSLLAYCYYHASLFEQAATRWV